MRTNLGNKHIVFLPQPVLIIATYDENGKPNAMNAAWGGQTDFDMISIALSKHKTTDNILLNKAFTISFATKKLEVISDYFGVVSAEKEDKIKKSGLTIEKSEFVNAPIILEYPLTLECEFVSYENEVLVGRVLNVNVDNDYINENGKIDVSKLELITYDSINGVYRELGGVVGVEFKDGLKFNSEK